MLNKTVYTRKQFYQYFAATIFSAAAIIIIYSLILKLLLLHIQFSCNSFFIFSFIIFSSTCYYLLRINNRKLYTKLLSLFLFSNIAVVFFTTLAQKTFNIRITTDLFFYTIKNISVLFEDTLHILKSISVIYFILFALFCLISIVCIKLSLRKIIFNLPPITRTEKKIILLLPLIFISSIITGKLILYNINNNITLNKPFQGTPLQQLIKKKHPVQTFFRDQMHIQLQDNPNVVFFILESVNSKHFDNNKSKYLNDTQPVIQIKNFFVPVPHTSTSMYSLFTANYANYRSESKLNSINYSNSLPAILKNRGYQNYFITTGPTYFEGLHALLEKFDLTIFNKEFFAKSNNPMTGKPYKSFAWGVDDIALLHKTRSILTQQDHPLLMYIAFNASHSPYFNPEPKQFNNFDNSTELGRYKNCIDYEIFIIDKIINDFIKAGLENTIFIVIGDHGESFGEHGYNRHSFSLYNSEIKVPCIIRHPAIKQKTEIENATLLDLTPSLVDMLGLKMTKAVYGKSFFDPEYKLHLFLSSWRTGDNKGLLLHKKKYLYISKQHRLLQMSLQDDNIKDISEANNVSNFIKFLQMQY